jgi:hypothetical protein
MVAILSFKFFWGKKMFQAKKVIFVFPLSLGGKTPPNSQIAH